MSTTIDERIVSMQFDNKNFENNVKTSLGTIERLKQSLKFKDSGKGLENIGNAAKQVNFNAMSKGVEQVKLKFSALEVMGVTALTNITNSAVNAGKRIASALTIDPIKTGFQEYETQINAVQTILANTSAKGTTIDQVNKALDELNTYADKTIYNFTEMTRNIGTFTAAGVDLDTSVSAIQGIANLAAVSGSSSQQASTAMYQLSQALASGTVKLQDWNSVVNAGMGGEVFQNALKRTAKVMGTDVDALIKKYGSFRESLTRGEWLTTDILTETLNQFTMAAEEGSKQWEEYKKSLKEKGYTEEQAVEILKMANTATDAATKVKTFTQLWDVLKESVQSGWAQTWKLIFGDFEEAKALFTPLSDFLTGFINRMSEARNFLLQGALDLATPWKSIADKLDKSGLGKIKDIADSVSNATHKLEDFQNIVNKVWRGDFGNADTGRYELLEKAGWDHRVVQDLVNKGYQHKITMEEVEASHKKFGLTMDKTSKKTDDMTSVIENLTDEQLKNAGLTDNEIRLYRDLAAEAKRTGKSIDELAEEMSKNDGRTLLIDSFKNAGKGLVTILKSIGEAWTEIFPPMSVVRLYSMIKGLNDFSKHLVVSDETADKLKRTLKGVFAILDIGLTLIGGPLSWAFKILRSVLGSFDLDILDVTAAMGDAIVKFRDWIDEHNIFVIGFKKVIEFLAKGAKAVQVWLTSFGESDNIPRDIILGIANGLRNGAEKVWKAVVDLGKGILEKIKGVLGIHSPSVEFFKIGINLIEGLINGIKSGLPKVWDTIVNFGKSIPEKLSGALSAIGNIFDWLKDKVGGFANVIKNKVGLGDLLVILAGAGIVTGIVKLAKALDKLTSPLEMIGDLVDGVSSVLNGAGKYLNAKTWQVRATVFLMLAGSLFILAASLALLTQLPQKKLWSSVGALSVLTLAIAALAGAIALIGKFGDFSKSAAAILALSVSMIILVNCIKQISNMKTEDAWKSVALLGAMAVGLAVIVGTLGKLVPNLSKGSVTFITMAIALKLLVGVLEEVIELDINKAWKAVPLLLSLMAGLALVSAASRSVKFGAGLAMIGMVISLKLLIGSMEDLAELDYNTISKALNFMIPIFGMFAAVMIASKFAGKNAAKAGIGILMMSVALVLIVKTISTLGDMDQAVMDTAMGTIKQLLLIFAGFIILSKVAGQNAAKAGIMLITMAGAMLALVFVIGILKHMSPEGMTQALVTIGILGLVMMGLIAVSKNAQGVEKPLGILVGAIALLAGVVIGLSFMDKSKLAAATIALTAIIGVFALLVKATKSLKTFNKLQSKQLMQSLGILMGVVALLAGLIIVLSLFKVGSTIDSAASIAVLLAALAGSLKVLSTIPVTGISKGVITSMYALTGVIAILAIIVGILGQFNIGPTLGAVTSMSTLIIALSGACVILSRVPVTGADAGILALVKIIAALALLLGALGAIMEFVPGAEKFLDNGVTVLTKIGEAIGGFVGGVLGGLVGGALEGITSALPKMADDLSLFMNKLNPFLDGAKSIDSGTLKAIGALAEALLMITAAELLNSISSFLGFGSSDLSDFADGLEDFGYAMASFSDEVKDIDLDAVDKGAEAGKKIADMAKAIPNTGGLVGLIMGNNDLDDFKEQLTGFGKGLWKFSEQVKDVNLDQVDKGAEAGKKIADMAKAIPNTGGLVSLILGDNKISDFKEQLQGFGTALKDFSDEVTGIDNGAVTAGADAGKTLANMANNIPNTGGLVALIFGDNKVDDFKDQLEGFGTAVKSFADEVKGIDTAAVTAGADAGITLAKMAKQIPDAGGVFSWLWDGDGDMQEFAKQLEGFGTAVKGFGDEVKGIDSDAVTAGAAAADALVQVSNNLQGDYSSGLFDWLFDTNLEKFSEALPSFGSAIADFASNVQGVDGEHLKTVVGLVSALVTLCTNGQLMLDFFTGDDIEEIKTNLVGFGEAMAGVCSELSSINTTNVNSAITVLDSFAGLFDKLGYYHFGKSLGTGESLATIGSELVSFAKSVKDFSAEVTGISDTDVTNATTAGVKMAEMAKGIYEAGGLKDINPGDVTISNLANDLAAYAKGITAFATEISSLQTTIDPDKFKTYAEAATELTKMLKGLEELYTYTNSIGDSGFTFNFAEQSYNSIETVNINAVIGHLKEFGTGVKEFSDSIQGVDTTKMTALANALGSKTDGTGFLNMVYSLPSNMLLETFGTQLVSFGHSLKVFSWFVTTINFTKMEELTTKITTIATDMAKASEELVDAYLTKFNTSKQTIFDSVTDMLSYTESAITKKTGDYEDSATELSKGIETGLISKKQDIFDSCEAMVTATANSIKTEKIKSAFASAGSYLASGFAQGITARTPSAVEAAKAMALAAKAAIAAILLIKSPSRVLYSFGEFVGEGFANGISDYTSTVYDTASGMGSVVSDGLRNALDKASNIIDLDIDCQPTIRPVIDLSEVTSGAGAISSIFNGINPSIDLLSNVGAINSMMNGRQNGRDDDVISAIKGLKDSIDSKIGNTYTINGITYDDGSNIADAVQSIIRAARIERRR